MAKINKKICDLCGVTEEIYCGKKGWANVTVRVQPEYDGNRYMPTEETDMDVCAACWSDKPRRIIDDVLDRVRGESREKMAELEKEWRESELKKLRSLTNDLPSSSSPYGCHPNCPGCPYCK